MKKRNSLERPDPTKRKNRVNGRSGGKTRGLQKKTAKTTEELGKKKGEQQEKKVSVEKERN